MKKNPIMLRAILSVFLSCLACGMLSACQMFSHAPEEEMLENDLSQRLAEDKDGLRLLSYTEEDTLTEKRSYQATMEVEAESDYAQYTLTGKVSYSKYDQGWKMDECVWTDEKVSVEDIPSYQQSEDEVRKLLGLDDSTNVNVDLVDNDSPEETLYTEKLVITVSGGEDAAEYSRDVDLSYQLGYSQWELVDSHVWEPETVENGALLITPDYNAVCPLEIDCSNTSDDYYIYVEYLGGPETTTVDRSVKKGAAEPYEEDLAFYVKAGMTAEVDVPIGKYQIYYASGSTFYGKERLFGYDTYYRKDDEINDFWADNTHYIGHTLGLEVATGGNSSSSVIDVDDFPSIAAADGS